MTIFQRSLPVKFRHIKLLKTISSSPFLDIFPLVEGHVLSDTEAGGR